MADLIRDFSHLEEEQIKAFWSEKKIPEKARKKNAGSRKKFYFMDGPPYATGHIHLGTALNKVLKDVAIRSRRMQGFDVFDRPGYDTHGLPIENKVEKKLGLKHKYEIEKFGVANFVEECKKFATEFISTMNNEFADLGVWMDWANPYLTLSPDYIEATWWTFKQVWKKGLLYLGSYPVHVCPRCGTALAYYEVDYTKLTDESIYVKFPVVGKPGTFLLIWTTTPWTLPGNTGVMVHPDFDYAFAKISNGETWILAKELLQGLMDSIGAGYAIEKVVNGKELEGLRYENPLSKYLKLPKLEDAYRVILSERYVTLEQGTGLVHCAPGHGKEDYEAGKKASLPVLCPVNIDGSMKEEAGKYAGKIAREVDKEIIADLEKDGFLVYKHAYTHDYPICWRCQQPLLMLSTPQWFFNISKIQKKLIDANEKVYWIPDWMKARMRNWLESLGDWPISRMRYWGTPMPIWRCEKCGKYVVVGTFDELKKLAKLKELPEPHRPYIDSVSFKCSCGGTMKRIPEVCDVWFDSGVSSWAALGFPRSKKLFKKFWPADLNLEATEQVRGWWNSQLIASIICFEKTPYKAVLVHGLILDIDKRKMSKSLGNVIMPSDVISKYGRDYLRYYFVKNSKGTDMFFSWQDFNDIRRFFNILINIFNYYSMYLSNASQAKSKKGLKVEDYWILSRYNSLIKSVLDAYERYEYWKIPQMLEGFVMDDFSRNYIKLVRDRTDEEKELLSAIFYEILLGVIELFAPLMPHLSEFFYQRLKKGKMPESIHLCKLPNVNKKLINKELEADFSLALEIMQSCLSLREKHKLRRRWPLKKLVVLAKDGRKLGRVLQLVKVGCNVLQVSDNEADLKGQNIACVESDHFKICLDISTTAELKDEWEVRELVRRIQAKRKEKGLLPTQKVNLALDCNDKSFIEKFKERIERDTNTKITLGKGKMEKILEREFYFEVL